MSTVDRIFEFDHGDGHAYAQTHIIGDGLGHTVIGDWDRVCGVVDARVSVFIEQPEELGIPELLMERSHAIDRNCRVAGAQDGDVPIADVSHPAVAGDLDRVVGAGTFAPRPRELDPQ